MERLRNEVIEALGRKLGTEYKIIPRDGRKNNGLILHGICIRREGDSVSPVIYVEGFTQPYNMGNPDPGKIADLVLKTYQQDKTPQDVADHLDDFGMAKEKIKIKLINYAANLVGLRNVPHRRFLDLAVTYYLDMELPVENQHASAAITNERMGIWGIAEDELYQLGMGKLLAGNGCCITDMFSILGQTMQEEAEEIVEWKKNQSSSGIYVASNKKGLFGAACLMNGPILHELAEGIGCSLIIFPSSVHELVIIPQKNGSESCMEPMDVQAINITQVPKDEWLSNSIYRYDREKGAVSVYKEGTPLLG